MIPASRQPWTPLLGLLCVPLACGADGAASEAQVEQTTSTEPGVEPSAIGEDTTEGVSPAGAIEPGEPCELDERVGSFRLYVGEDRTILAGAVHDRVVPTSVPEVIASEGTCSLVAPRNLFCSSTCPSGQVCAGEDECVDAADKVSAGTASVSGALAEMEAEPNAITQEYSTTVLEPFPAFEPGAAIGLSLAGGDTEPFTLKGWGVAPMKTEAEVVSVTSGSAVAFAWDASAADVERSNVFIHFSVNLHGAVTGWIDCTADDDGSFEIPAGLVTQLINMGLSGFPRATLGRRSLDRTTLASGCVDFEVSSEVTIELEVDGLISCGKDADCPDGQTCSMEAVCE